MIPWNDRGYQTTCTYRISSSGQLSGTAGQASRDKPDNYSSLEKIQKMKRISLIISIVLAWGFNCYSQTESSSLENIALAAGNIFEQLDVKSGSKVVLVNSASKTKVADYLKTESRTRNISLTQFSPDMSQDSLNILASLIQDQSGKYFFIFLIDPSDAQFLFQYAGRPDMGLKIPEDKLVCDWLISEVQFIRLNSIDINENTRYQEKLRAQLNTADTIFISTKSGTNIRFVARNWIIDKGEIFCTPIETETNGVIVVDGCAYWGPPLRPVRLKIHNGRVVNIDDLSEEDKQEKWIRNDLTADDNASILSEVGIGTNKNALWNSDLMESEQSRGTCHFGFGMNLNYGGQIESKKHFDLVVLNPTIEINGTLVYENGTL